MKNRILFILLSVLIITGLTACSSASKAVESTAESIVTAAGNISDAESTQTTAEKETATSETTTKQSSDSDTTTKPAEQKSAGQTTAKSTTAKQTTTQKATASTTKNQTTTKKVTATQKKTTTTTKKVTTTAAPYWCDEGGTRHSCDVGPIGWVNSYEEARKKPLNILPKMEIRVTTK